jgi:hypothetical protein
MADHKAYLGDLVGGGLMIREAQIIAEFLTRNPDPIEWNSAIQDQNILQKGSPATAKRTAEAIRIRIVPMGSNFYELFAYGSSELCSQLMLAAVIINSPILGDFMSTVIVEAKRVYRDQLEASDWASFWEERGKLFSGLSQIADSSAYKVQKMAFKCLADAGYIQSTRIRKLQNVYLLPEVKHFLEGFGRSDVVRIMELEA